MMPDEIRRLPRDKAILLIRGSKPLMLSKIMPEELPAFDKLQYCKAIDHIPRWRKKEDEPCAPVAQSTPPAPDYQVRLPLDAEEEESEEYIPDEEELNLNPPIDLSGGIDCKTLTEVSPEDI